MKVDTTLGNNGEFYTLFPRVSHEWGDLQKAHHALTFKTLIPNRSNWNDAYWTVSKNLKYSQMA